MPARPRIHALAAALALPSEPGTGDQPPAQPNDALGTAEPEIRAATPAQAVPAQALPRTRLDVIPLAVAGVAILLAGLALWRRPHARR